MISDRLRTQIIVAVTMVWMINFFAGLMPFIDYEPDQMINGIFMGIVGTAYVASARNPPHLSGHKDSEVKTDE